MHLIPQLTMARLKNKSAVTGYLCTSLSVIGVMSCAGLASPATAAIATFDSFSEGFYGTTLTDEGITFSDLERRISGPDNPVFVIERADTNDSQPLGRFFSPPNILGFGGYSPGQGYGLGRFGSARITTGSLGSTASLDIFSFPRYQWQGSTDNILTLEAYLDGRFVSSNSIGFNFIVNTDSDYKPLNQRLSLSGIAFDELRLVASGSEDQGVVFFGIDNVRIDETVSVPEPSSKLGVLALSALGVSSLLKRKMKRKGSLTD